MNFPMHSLHLFHLILLHFVTYIVFIFFLFYLAGNGGKSSMGFSGPKVSCDISQDFNLVSVHIFVYM